MNRLLLPSLLFALSGLALPAQAGTSSCVTINGEQTCTESGKSLNCQTIEGKTTCVGDDVTTQHHHISRVETTPKTTKTPTMYTDADGHVHVKTGDIDVDITAADEDE